MNQGVIMKKFIQIVSFFALVFVMSGVNVNAQGSTKIDAVIPYDFQIGDEEFEAGKYVLRIRRSSGGASIAELRDSRHKIVHESFLMENGNTGSGKANLVFDKSGPIARLTQVRTGSKGYAVDTSSKPDTGVNLASKKKKKDREAKN
jgi:hypothetical protein